ncbi:TetR/AcrR family transcriptional regulator [Leucobacter ruminantium]|uniref:TetR/AcrR family transcriptional regulator n=1 Tax=Leucobacter ruminantium TaxID=1289170 RepID=A0A939RZF0_9MICO|nr:TetR/AcrR family transcriptional regulator [Leucobacter ruminantium]MBO1806663.1 TetR/AcrR family transcriptional regulator [Leucobacter ruminantium]
MTAKPASDTREQLIAAAAELIAASPGEDFSLRAVCDAVGVRMPTLYHFFGSKQGLIEAVIQHGFDVYLSKKASAKSSGDPIQDIRAGWDAHVAFGTANPGFYTLMYGKVAPGYVPAPQSRATALLGALTQAAADQGRLAVSAELAADHILSTNVGVTLRQIAEPELGDELSVAVREGVLTAITTKHGPKTGAVIATIELALDHAEVLGDPETQVLVKWLRQLSTAVM